MSALFGLAVNYNHFKYQSVDEDKVGWISSLRNNKQTYVKTVIWHLNCCILQKS